MQLKQKLQLKNLIILIKSKKNKPININFVKSLNLKNLEFKYGKKLF